MEVGSGVVPPAPEGRLKAVGEVGIEGEYRPGVVIQLPAQFFGPPPVKRDSAGPPDHFPDQDPPDQEHSGGRKEDQKPFPAFSLHPEFSAVLPARSRKSVTSARVCLRKDQPKAVVTSRIFPAGSRVS